MSRAARVREVRAVLRGRGSVLLTGPAGIGKSTAATRATQGLSAVVAQCLEVLQTMSHRPLSHVVGSALTGTAEELAVEVAGRLHGKVLVVEDVHWADPTTLEVVALLVGRLPMIITSRVGVPSLESVVTKVVAVEPLDDDEADALARTAHPHLSDDDRAALVHAAGGNPLLVQHLANDGSVSPTLQAAITDRIANMPDDELDAWGRLALHGRPVEVGEFAAHMGGADGVVVIDDGRQRFAHELFRSAVLSVLDDARIQRLRAELAACVSGADAVHHLLALGRLDEAAERAVEGAATADVQGRAELLELAVDALGDRAPAELRLRASEAALSAHRPVAAQRHASVVTGDDPAMAEAALHIAMAAWLLGDRDRADSELTRALDLVGGTDSELEARVLVERAHVAVRSRVGDPGIVELADAAIDAAQRHDVDLARALSAAGLARSHTGRTGWRELFQRAIEVAAADGDDEEGLAARYWLVSALGFYGPMDEAIELGRDCLQDAARLGRRRWHHHFLGAHLVQLATRGAATDQLVAAGRQLLVDEPWFRNRAQVELALVVALLDRDDHATAADVVAAGVDHARNGEDLALLACARCEIALAIRDHTLMQTALDEIVATGAGFFGHNAVAESAAIHLSIADATPIVIPSFPSERTPVLDVVQRERAALLDARAGRTEQAIEHLLDAAAEWDRRTLHRFARRARASAVDLAMGSGDLGFAERLLAEARKRPDRSTGGVSNRRLDESERVVARARRLEVLTPREREVIGLVATGLTNREIATHLSIAVTTVDSHVARAMQRLGCRTRRQVAALLAG